MAARVHDLSFERQSFELALPVPLLYGQANVNFVARTINAALGKNERVQIFGQNIVDAVDVEAREVELSIFARVRNERNVIAIPRDERDRHFLANRFFDRRKAAMTVRIRLRGLEGNAVLAEEIDNHIRKRLALFDRQQENVVTAVRVFLGQDSDVSNENEARILDPNPLVLSRVPALRGQEKEAALAPAVGRLAQMLAEIERGIIRLPFVFHRDSLPLGRDAGNVFLVEIIRHLEERVLEFSFRLADQMIDLRRGYATDLELDRAERARAN